MFKKILFGSAILIYPILFTSCVSDDINKVNCDTSDLAITADVTDATTCSSTDGSITVAATGGRSPYTFSKDGVNFSSSATFNVLSAGNYNLSVKDSDGCVRSVDATVGGSSVTASATIETSSGCGTSSGQITITASGGSAPYNYKLGADSFTSSNTFSGLAKGVYLVTVKDAIDCQFIVSDIKVTTGVSFQSDIKPILEANCIKSGCHNGDNGAERNWSVFANVQAKAAGIKTRTGNKSMPFDIAPTGLPQNQIDLIACWVDDGALNN